MDKYIVFQLFIDSLLFAIIIAYVVRDSGRRESEEVPEMPDLDELRDLVDEFKSAISRSEKTAQNLDDQLKARRDSLEALKVIRPVKPAKEKHADFLGKSEPMQKDMTTDERKRRVKILRLRGMQKEDIAKELSMPLSEVELMIKMAAGAD